MFVANRRQFLQAAATAGVGVALGAAPAVAIDPIARTGKAQIRLSLAAYSYRRYLELKQKEKPKMTLADFIDASATMPLDAVELTAYYFPETQARRGSDSVHKTDRPGARLETPCLRRPSEPMKTRWRKWSRKGTAEC